MVSRNITLRINSAHFDISTNVAMKIIIQAKEIIGLNKNADRSFKGKLLDEAE